MQEIQSPSIKGEYTEDQVVSTDETGIFFGAGAKHQYVPTDADRATNAPADEKSRFTALMSGNKKGHMLPTKYILKCSSKTPSNLSKTTTLSSLHNDARISCRGWLDDGHVDKDSNAANNKKKPKGGGPAPLEAVTFVRPYLIAAQRLHPHQSTSEGVDGYPRYRHVNRVVPRPIREG